MKSKVMAVVIGLILGDGYVSKPRGNSKCSMLDIKYDQRYLTYMKWLHDQLQSLNPSLIKKKKGYHQYRFYTESRKDIGELRGIFYPNGKKRIPLDIKKYLVDPITIAVWYQDDGTLDQREKYHSNSLFATHCFSKRQCQLLANTLRMNFDLDVRVCRCLMRGKLRFRLYVTSRSMDKFMRLIEPYIQECFYYKLVKNRLVTSQQQR